MKHVIMLSGGVGSWAAGKRVIEQQAPKDVALLFTDTLIEDPDTYRFLLDSSANLLGIPLDLPELENLRQVCLKDLPHKGAHKWLIEESQRVLPGLVWLADGRTIWEVFKDTKSFPRQFIDPCSRVLKRELADRWVSDNCEIDSTVLYVGIDWSEIHRFERLVEYKKPWNYQAPLCNAPYLAKQDLHDWATREGLKMQRLYKLGMSHANCGGGCVKMGKGGFVRLLRADPAKYAEWEANEEDLRQHLNVNLAILRDQKDSTSKPVTLRELRERVESGSQVDLFDIGGCGCFLDDSSQHPTPAADPQ